MEVLGIFLCHEIHKLPFENLVHTAFVDLEYFFGIVLLLYSRGVLLSFARISCDGIDMI